MGLESFELTGGNGRRAARRHARGVLVAPALEDLEVSMRSGRETGGAHSADDLLLRDTHAGANARSQVVQVRVAGLEAVGVP